MAKTRLDEHSFAWAKALAAALKRWLKENGYKFGSQLANELKIKQTIWKHIQGGGAVSTPDVYARIFRRTHLAEADPCALPPRRRHVPKQGIVEETRAWTLAQYRNWLSKQGRAPEGKTPPTVAKPAEGPGGVLEQLVSELQQTRRAVELLTQFLQPTGALDEVEILAQKLKARMDLAISGTAAARDRFQTKYGANVAALLALADALSEKEREEREKKAARIREFGEVQL